MVVIFASSPPSFSLNDVVVRPVYSTEKSRWKALMSTHHYLGFSGTGGKSIFYVATIGDTWCALLCWSSAALHVNGREEWISWSGVVKEKRLKYIANNTRFLILPGFNLKNLASKVLSLNVRRLSSDWQKSYGHSIWMAETFVDPSRYRGSCYLAANWQNVAKTKGYSRVSIAEGFYRLNHQPKMYLAYPLIKNCLQRLANPQFEDKRRGGYIVVDISKLPIDGKNGLIQTLKQVKDPRRRQGRVHTNTSVLAIAACAMLSGARGFKGIAEWSSKLTPAQLNRLRCRKNTPPSESTIQRVLRKTNAQEFDDKVCNWLVKASSGTTSGKGVAVDGKVLRGSNSSTGKQVQLLSALLHEEKIVISQRQIDSKENEITEFKDLLKNVELEGLLVTADALHCQVSHAEFLVNEKNADFLFNVKDNQETLRTLVEEAVPHPNRPTTSSSIITTKAHGRIDTRECFVKDWTFDLANQHRFPYINQIFCVKRSWTDLSGGNEKGETRYFITSANSNSTNAEVLLRAVLDHWSIENSSHYVRDETFGEDRSRIRTGSAPYILATLRNLSIGIIRLAGEKNIASGVRYFGWGKKEKALKVIGV